MIWVGPGLRCCPRCRKALRAIRATLSDNKRCDAPRIRLGNPLTGLEPYPARGVMHANAKFLFIPPMSFRCSVIVRVFWSFYDLASDLNATLLGGENDWEVVAEEAAADAEEEKSTRRLWVENKKLWLVAGPSIFARFLTFGVTVITQAFVGHFGATDLRRRLHRPHALRQRSPGTPSDPQPTSLLSSHLSPHKQRRTSQGTRAMDCLAVDVIHVNFQSRVGSAM